MYHLGLDGRQTSHLATTLFLLSACVTTFPLSPLEIPVAFWKSIVRMVVIPMVQFSGYLSQNCLPFALDPLFFCMFIFQGISGLVQQFNRPPPPLFFWLLMFSPGDAVDKKRK
jgi:hypothetical protein